MLERTADIPVFIAVSAVQSGYFHNKVRSILVLPGALGADHLVRMKDIHSLAAEYRVFMGQSMAGCFRRSHTWQTWWEQPGAVRYSRESMPWFSKRTGDYYRLCLPQQ